MHRNAWYCIALIALFAAPAYPQSKSSPPTDTIVISPHDREILHEAEKKIEDGTLTKQPLTNTLLKLFGASTRSDVANMKRKILPTPPYLEKLFGRILYYTPRSLRGPYHFRLVYADTEDSWVHADGTIIISRENVTRAEDEAQLAALICHELSHLFQRHSAEDAIVLNYLLERGIDDGVAKYLAGHDDLDDLDTLTNHQQLRADKMAMQLLADLGYNPCSLPRYWRNAGVKDTYIDEDGELLKDVTCKDIGDTAAHFHLATPYVFYKFIESQKKY